MRAPQHLAVPEEGSVRMLTALTRIQAEIVAQAPLESVLQAVVDAVADLLGDGFAALLLGAEDDPDRLELTAWRGYADDDVARMRTRRSGEGAAGLAYADNRLAVIEDYADAADAMAHFAAVGVTAAMAAPIHERGRPIGSLLNGSDRPGRRFGAAERELLVALAGYASVAIADAKQRRTMAHQATHDALTALPNRTLLADRLDHALARAARHGSAPVSLLFLDLDGFKRVNDTLGHPVGDAVLLEVADRLRTALRASDTAARMGGDEFAVLVEDGSDGEVVARRLLECLQVPVAVAGRTVTITASVGIATGCADGEELLRSADLALYRAKETGTGTFAHYAPSMAVAAIDQLVLGADLERAVADGAIEVHYQPIVALDGDRLVGFEALTRWRHHERGLLGPAVWVPLAEQTGQMPRIGAEVLRQACAQAVAWRAEHGGEAMATICVNISSSQLDDAALPTVVRDVLAASGLPPSSLVLELTEGSLMHDPAEAAARLRELKRVGVRVAVDDFGTGFSSLQRLREFPVDVLKIAREFVDGVTTDASQEAMVRTILALGENLGLDVVAEGIETAEQGRMLATLGCGLGQGYHYARPLPAGAAGELF